MTPQWTKNAIFYHIYPLGLCGAPSQNDYNAPPAHRLQNLLPWLDHIQSMGANALYLGPVFQSASHGYDTVDYYQIDRRLGDQQDMRKLAEAVHQRGMRLILDAVFNHVGRDFWAFKDVIAHGENSAYRDWFYNLNFGERSPNGDPFNYEGWSGHYSLVKLNLSHPQVRAHLFDAVRFWLDQFSIDGLRLDAADSIDFDFLRALRDFATGIRSDFWLMGEVVHGDYRQWANPSTLHAVTNYEAYKGLFSSLKDGNYHEIAYTLNRQFGSEGIYRDLDLYNFVDNHDVDRVASKLNSPDLLYPLYILLFTMPGIPSLYYGSEWGIAGVKDSWSDAALRPSLNLDDIQSNPPQPTLAKVIQQLSHIRSGSEALCDGIFQPLHVAGRQFAFIRQSGSEKVIAALNSAPETAEITLNLPDQMGAWEDLLNPNQRYQLEENRLKIAIPPTWGCLLNPIS